MTGDAVSGDVASGDASTDEENPESSRAGGATAVAAGGLNRPVRWVIAAVETLVAAAAVLSGIWLWHAGIVGISYPVGDDTMLDSTRLLGDHAGGAIALVTVAGLLMIDAVRQAALASHASHRRKEQRELAEWQRIESEARTGGSS